MHSRLTLATLMLSALTMAAPPSVRAAEAYDNCTGFIDAVPATISTQGTWCLRQDLGTAMSSGAAITIATNNVILDCNDFKLGGMAAGPGSDAYGIYAFNRQNITVRRCAVRGFRIGVYLSGDGGSGHSIEDNRLDQNLQYGIVVRGDNNQVRRNRVYDTGGYSGNAAGASIGIDAHGDVLDNTVADVSSATHGANGILQQAGNAVRDNQVRGLSPASGQVALGIWIGPSSSGARVAGNHVTATATTNGFGIRAPAADTLCIGNTVANFATAYESCDGGASNLTLP